MGYHRCTRAEDDFVLELLRLRARMTSVQLEARYGIPRNQIRVMTNRVRNADLDESGEPAADVLAGYGWQQ
jgi:hypothetical protein